MSVQLTRELIASGYTHHELARQTRSGDLVHLRRGAYYVATSDQLSRSDLHLRVIEATLRLGGTSTVASHLSAAVVHGLPIMSHRLARVQLTRSNLRGGKQRGPVRMYAAALDSDEIVERGGLLVTSLARTVVDLARSIPFGEAVMAGDEAVRRDLTAAELEWCLARSSRRPGMVQARRATRFLNPLSESPGESLSRAVLHQASVPAPTLQHEIRDGSGRLVGRVDFCWEEHRTCGEFDGRIKYGRALEAAGTSEETVYREKVREDALRDCGWQVVRWSWTDLKTPEVITDRLQRAFVRADRRR